MRIGVPKEIKEQEYRVGMTPDSVRALTHRGHTVLVQHSAGFEAGFSDEAIIFDMYLSKEPAEIFERAVKNQIILEEITLPDVPRNVLEKYPKIMEGINKLESKKIFCVKFLNN